LNAFDFSQTLLRKSITLEVFRFWADYHGFAVFAGPAFSYEKLRVEETHGNQSNLGVKEGWRPGITLGWDIRPNRLQSWYLRTNIRYFPGMHVSMPSHQKIRFDQMEFNFIQLVIFPGRWF
jgi:hypothetical protein